MREESLAYLSILSPENYITKLSIISHTIIILLLSYEEAFKAYAGQELQDKI